MPATYAHLMITDKGLERLRGHQDVEERLCGPVLTDSHFVHLGSVGALAGPLAPSPMK
jgi:hypothetical protein